MSGRLIGKSASNTTHFYFTAPPQHLGRVSLLEYFDFKSQLTASGVIVVEGRFQKSQATCKSCGFRADVYKEKETDVSIAVRICETALDSDVQQLILFSADSDLAPALEFAHRQNPNLHITIAQTGKFLKFAAYSLVSKANTTVKLSAEFIHMYQFQS